VLSEKIGASAPTKSACHKILGLRSASSVFATSSRGARIEVGPARLRQSKDFGNQRVLKSAIADFNERISKDGREFVLCIHRTMLLTVMDDLTIFAASRAGTIRALITGAQHWSNEPAPG
jgi:hypothetical protein